MEDREYSDFSEYMTEYLYNHKEYEPMMTYANKHKFRCRKFILNLFLAYKENKIEWFLNNRLAYFNKYNKIID